MDTDRRRDPSPIIARARGISRRTALGRLASAGVATALLATVARDSVQAQATPKPQGEEGVEPNHFVLADAETTITYTVATDAGEPQLTYQGPYGDQSFTGRVLTIETSALGRLVTGDLGAFPDQGEVRVTLLLPTFNPMTTEDDPALFTTLAILTWVVSTIAGPPRQGALEEYRVVTLEGTAQLIMT